MKVFLCATFTAGSEILGLTVHRTDTDRSVEHFITELPDDPEVPEVPEVPDELDELELLDELPSSEPLANTGAATTRLPTSKSANSLCFVVFIVVPSNGEVELLKKYKNFYPVGSISSAGSKSFNYWIPRTLKKVQSERKIASAPRRQDADIPIDNTRFSLAGTKPTVLPEHFL
ncbi:hypothetical protein U2W12_18730 [Methylomicrobium sp. Wu6]|nr:hypothetical protein [Methylomicrobium sp. Wu6]